MILVIFFISFVFLATLGMIVGMLAKSRDRSFLPWFFYGASLFPVAIVHINKARRRGKRCLSCQEVIAFKATVCRHCDFHFA